MAATPDLPGPGRPIRRWWPVASITVLLSGLIVVLGLSWWLTEPLVDDDEVASSGPPAKADVPEPTGPPTWPDSRIEGKPAKELLLATLQAVAASLETVEGYTTTLRRRERIGGKLGPEQTMMLKVRNRPFAIYLKVLAPKAGKEVIYAEGHHENKMIAHAGDWTRRLIPRLAVAPDSAIALADNRHPITDAGLVHLTRRLVNFREMDLVDNHSETILDRAPGPDGRPWPRSIHLHPKPDDGRPFARVEILYHPESFLPMEIFNYDWLPGGQPGELPLAESYRYADLVLNAPLTALDFDPANPDYEFARY